MSQIERAAMMVDAAAIKATIEEYQRQAQAVAQQADQLRAQLAQAEIVAHQLNGAVGALEALLGGAALATPVVKDIPPVPVVDELPKAE